MPRTLHVSRKEWTKRAQKKKNEMEERQLTKKRQRSGDDGAENNRRTDSNQERKKIWGQSGAFVTFIQKRDIPRVTELRERGVDPFASSDKNATPIAAALQDTEMFNLIVNFIRTKETTITSPNRNVEAVVERLAAGSNPGMLSTVLAILKASGYRTLSKICTKALGVASHDARMLDVLCEYGDPGAQNFSALQFAMRHGYAEGAVRLIRDVPQSQKPELAAKFVQFGIERALIHRPFGVLSSDIVDTIKALLQHCSEKGLNQALLSVCGGDSPSQALLLAILGAGANPNTTGPTETTLLEMILCRPTNLSSSSGCFSSDEARSVAARMLLSSGAVPVNTDGKGRPLSVVVSQLMSSAFVHALSPWYGVMSELNAFATTYIDGVRKLLEPNMIRDLASITISYLPR